MAYRSRTAAGSNGMIIFESVNASTLARGMRTEQTPSAGSGPERRIICGWSAGRAFISALPTLLLSRSMAAGSAGD
jgi:hypothetical protein